MSYYTIRVDLDKLEPLSEIGSRELTTWNGVRNKSLKSRYITDGHLFVDKKHVADKDFFETLTARKNDAVIENERIKSLIDHLEKEKQWDAQVLGQRKASRFAMGAVKSKWVALISYKDEKQYCLADAQAVEMVDRLLGGSGNLKVGDSEVLTWWKYGVPVGGLATWGYYDVKITD